MRKNSYRILAAISAASLLLAVTASAKAYTVSQPSPLLPSSTFGATIDLSGLEQVQGTGAVVDNKIPSPPAGNPGHIPTPFTIIDPGATSPVAFGLFGGAQSGAATPTDVDPLNPTTWTLTDPNLHTLSNISGLDVDLLNGQSIPIALDTIDIFTNIPAKAGTHTLLADITVDIAANVQNVSFAQSAAAIMTNLGVGTGTFDLPGTLTAGLSDLNATIFGLLTVPVGDQTITTPGDLTGTYTVTNIPGGRHIALDGSANLSVPLSLITALSTAITNPASLTIDASVGITGSVLVSFGYHFETNVVPEPGSIVLLGLGLAALVPVVRFRRKR